LYNSAKYAAELLERNGYPVGLVEVIDGNDIDREIEQFQPDVVIIEALWVTPDKLAENVWLHPGVEWIVRLHSEIPFLAVEGIAMEWVRGYWKIPHVLVSANTEECRQDLYVIQQAAGQEFTRIPLLPTYYHIVEHTHQGGGHPKVLHCACPGAMRPLKNQLTQAVAALRYAEDHKKRLHFYVNTTVSADGGISMLRNVVNLFKGTPHELIQIAWKNHYDFIQLLRSMDVALQVSFSESMNLCAADMVSCHVPSVTSNQIRWSSKQVQAECTSTEDIEEKMNKVLSYPVLVAANLAGLRRFCNWARRLWLEEFER
jgi:hypothetical protein